MSGEGDLKLTEKFEKATVVLIDIAGTSSSICFVKDTLFPYVLNKSESYLTDKWENTDVQELVKVLRENDPEILKEGDKDAIIKSIGVSIKSLSEKNSDLECFKKFQGLIYIEGYGSGDLKGHVYPDVATQLPVWANGKKVCVYSTGSVDSQKLLFTHSSEGNLTEHITEYFDMAAGVKTEAASYKKIAEKLQCKPEEIVFLTDSVAEAKAAVEAGVNPVLVSREGNEEIAEDDKKQFPVITSFTELSMESSGKRKITEEAEQEAPPAKVAKKELETKEEKPVEKAAPAPAEAEEKMEVDAPEVATEAKADEPMEKCNDTETVTSTSETTDEPKEKKEPEAAEAAAETKEAESKEEKPVEKEKEKEKDVPSTTDKAEEKSSVEEKKTETKTEEMETVVSESKPEETEKQTEKVESTETKNSDKKETEKENVVETTKETVVDSTDKKETEEIKDKVDSSNDTKEEPKLETNEVAETKDKKDKVCEEKHETEATKEPENAKTDSEVAKVEEKTVEPEEKKKVEKEKEEAKPETNESAPDTKESAPETKESAPDKKESAPDKKESAPDKKESAPDTKESAPETNDATPEKKESKETTVDGAVKETKASEKAEEKVAEKEETPAKEADDDKSKNGDAKENGNTNNKSEEKENKSELANGAHIENGDEKKIPEEESEIKVKKIETENSETTEAAVSVEVKA